MSDFRKVQPGDPLKISAGTFNAMIDVAKAHRSGQLALGHDRPLPAHSGNIVVPVRNDTGADVGRFGILGLDGPIFEPDAASDDRAFLRGVSFSGVPPFTLEANPPNRTHEIAIMQEPVRAGRIGMGLISGVSYVRVDFQHARHRAAQPIHGETGHMVSAPSGPASIVWRELGEHPWLGERWAIVSLHGTPSDWPRRFTSTFTSPGVWSAPDHTSIATIILIGAGGGGGGGGDGSEVELENDGYYRTGGAGGGGGSSGASVVYKLRTLPGMVLTIEPGAGGTGGGAGVNGGDGGDTTVAIEAEGHTGAITLRAAGGAGGEGAAASLPGKGGEPADNVGLSTPGAVTMLQNSTSAEYLTFSAGSGHAGQAGAALLGSNPIPPGGRGGARGRPVVLSRSGSANGRGEGGDGGAGAASPSGSAEPGGDGRDGCVIIVRE